ncbi:MAG: hypothetical protein ABI868_17560 [Acidobacteriota bacterium]
MRVLLFVMAATLASWRIDAQERTPAAPQPATERAPQTTPQKTASASPATEPVAPPAAPPAGDASPASMARVREKLKAKPPTISGTRPKADFSLTIEQRRPLQEMFYVPPWATSPLAQAPLCAPRGASYLPVTNCGSPSGFSVDPGQMFGSIKRAFDGRAARDEVRRTIIEYCAAQPNGGAGIKICADEAR